MNAISQKPLVATTLTKNQALLDWVAKWRSSPNPTDSLVRRLRAGAKRTDRGRGQAGRPDSAESEEAPGLYLHRSNHQRVAGWSTARLSARRRGTGRSHEQLDGAGRCVREAPPDAGRRDARPHDVRGPYVMGPSARVLEDRNRDHRQRLRRLNMRIMTRMGKARSTCWAARPSSPRAPQPADVNPTAASSALSEDNTIWSVGRATAATVSSARSARAPHRLLPGRQEGWLPNTCGSRVESRGQTSSRGGRSRRLPARTNFRMLIPRAFAGLEGVDGGATSWMRVGSDADVGDQPGGTSASRRRRAKVERTR